MQRVSNNEWQRVRKGKPHIVRDEDYQLLLINVIAKGVARFRMTVGMEVTSANFR